MKAAERPPAIHQPGIWAEALKATSASSASSKKSDTRESYVYIVGSKGSGKSALISKYLRPHADPKKGSDTVDYSFARKANSEGRMDVANIWELPGSASLSTALTVKDQDPHRAPVPPFFLPTKSVNTAVVVIAVDLSKPGQALEIACEWLKAIDDSLQERYKLLERNGSKLPAQLKVRAQRVSFSAAPEHPDRDVVRFSGVQVIICATKYDALRGEDTAVKATVSRALRFAAHLHGAHLCYMGDLGSSGRSSAEDRAEGQDMSRKLRNLMTHALFAGFDKKPPVEAFKRDSRSRRHPEVDPEGPICVLHGSDSCQSIGGPDGGRVVDANATLRAWREKLCAMFPESAAPARPPVSLESLAPDAGIDNLVQRMAEQLQSQLAKERSQLERQRVLKAKKDAAAGSPKKKPSEQRRG